MHGKGAKRKRDSEAAAATAAEPHPPAHPVSGGLSQHHPTTADKQPSEQNPLEGQQAVATAAAEEEGAKKASATAAGESVNPKASEPVAAAAAAAGTAGLGLVGLAPAATGAGGAAAGAGGMVEHPRIRGSGPQLDMMTGKLGFKASFVFAAAADIAR